MKKLFTSIFLAIALLTISTNTAFAQEATPITGTVESVVIETNPVTGETSVIVSLLNEAGMSQTVTISLESAEILGLVTTDLTTGNSTVIENVVGTVVEIDPSTVLPVEDIPAEEEEQHPVGSALSNFFSDLLGVDYETIMTHHEDGVGFGVIAQALWLTNSLDGSTETFDALLTAKQSGDYSTIILADGSTPDNWGDVVKSLKKGDNLGSIMSGKAEAGTDVAVDASEVSGNENSGNGNGNNGNGNGNANKDKDKGGGKP